MQGRRVGVQFGSSTRTDGGCRAKGVRAEIVIVKIWSVDEDIQLTRVLLYI